MVLQLSDRQRLQWLRLIRTPNVGPASFRDLINRFGSAEAALDMLPELAARGGARRAVRIPTLAEAEAELVAVRKVGARIIAIGEASYPANMAQMDNPPPLITVFGSDQVFASPSVSIVGARNASLAGINFARKLATDLGKHGWTVTSGMARGIDTAAHKGALHSGTTAVLAGGIDRPYPPENIPLMHEIVEKGGAIVCEMPFGWEPRAQDFPRRNRIIAGLSLGLVVVEAAMRSGSLISARMAGEQGRVVFAVPGSPLDPRSAGTNGLLKQGAILVTGADDIIEHLTPMLGIDAAPRESFEEPVDFADVPMQRDDDRARLVGLLGPTPTSVDDLIAHSGVHPANVQLILLELDLAGRLERHRGGLISLVS
ncbi:MULTISPECIES: DNA-processing protein DprA [Mesorhizobium]|uniref:DNA-protecting protein DprA n=1 Tax=Mesorhizobium denitrificans TaxID=2294114 RepID=A0A371XDG0_9HYPH|nr:MULTISPECIES: DNA-processing protein DprA [Mesorhizobium]RFC67268.1 DNA-protecting protein DprA [Mesorhizobium denitrificans]